ncbi:MAG TPA: glycosyltransferase family 39 protein [Pyrinomonadaceae bacterium]|nr:glycosyltransferase family 39 protein [Pyrinomonadaceae bacterium]
MSVQEKFNPRGEVAVALYLSALKLLIHFLTNGGYGYFRDELYYLACGEHLDWGYVDQAPLIAVVAWFERAVFGDSLFALRLLPALAGAATVFLTGLIAREAGGRRFAVLVACVSVIVAPYFLSINTILTMNAFEPLVWVACAYLLVRILKYGESRLWIPFGLVAGLGLMNKHSTLAFGFAVVAGLAVAQSRRQFLNPWLWAGGAVALLVFAPNVIWQVQHGWPTVEVLRNADKNQNVAFSLAEFVKGQVLLMHPLTFPVWAAGLYFYLFRREARPFRALGWAFVALFALMVVFRAKVYYMTPFYPILLASGGVQVETWLGARPLLRAWARPALVVVLLAGGALFAPLALPVLPVETFIRYQSALGIEPPRTEKLKLAGLPQLYADMFGWEEMTREVAGVYNSLPPEERERCAVFARNYGEAGAIDFFGPRYGLPKSIGKHQNYFLWGPRDYTGECVITIGEKLSDVSKSFDQVEQVATFTHPYVLPHENNNPVFLCRKPKRPLKEIWPDVKCYSC